MAKAKAKKEVTRGERVIAFIETYCRIPEGSKVGQPMKLIPFQRQFILDIYDNPTAKTRRAYLSIARKNGKTALIACILLAHIVGPEAVQNSQIVSGAMSRDQAALVFELASKMIMLDNDLKRFTKIIPSSKKIYGLPMNVEYKALAADSTTAHGLSPVLAILDEVGQIVGPTSPFVEAITTSQGAHSQPLLIAISTSSASDSDMFSMWIDAAKRETLPGVVCHEYKADEDCDMMDEAQWVKANPALGIFRSKEDMRIQMTQAKNLPALESSARNLMLNQRVSQETLFMSPLVWKRNNAKPEIEVFRNFPVSVGLDLSARNDLTAAIFAAMDDAGEVHILPYVFCPTRGIEERSRRDRAPYATWVKNGNMMPLGGETMDYEQISRYLRNECDRLQIAPTTVEFDRWRIEDFKKTAEQNGFAQFATWNPVGQGYQSFSPRCEAFMSLALEGRLRHGGHPLLNMAAQNAIAVKDAAGSVKLDKSKSTQRIDPLVAAVMAVYAVSEGRAKTLGADLSWMVA
jgi:phage terminase large subunit-like protein